MSNGDPVSWGRSTKAGDTCVSVVIPVFNGRDHILQALDTVALQTFHELEIIVVDDGSTDETAALVSSHSDPRITLLSQPNKGPSAARNRGIQRATGKYVAFLDADDQWSPHKLEDQLAALDAAADARWAYSSAITTSYQTGEEMAAHPAIHSGNILCAVMRHNCIAGSASSVIVDRQLLLQVGGFDETLGFAEDWELWARLAAASPVACAGRTAVILRSRENSYGADVEKMRTDSLRFLEKAFRTYAKECEDARPAAIAWIHFLAGLGLRSQRRRIPALLAFSVAIWHRPLWLRTYASILAMVTPRPIRNAYKLLMKPHHVVRP